MKIDVSNWSKSHDGRKPEGKSVYMFAFNTDPSTISVSKGKNMDRVIEVRGTYKQALQTAVQRARKAGLLKDSPRDKIVKKRDFRQQAFWDKLDSQKEDEVFVLG